ncbi:glycosyltransferase family 2 protein [Ferroglobus sp.]|uniref:glycosyltransferase family 2 protein n=1 Tax=Ferroglobus sp. TaxID=2614230 RepID=UPI0025BF8F4B|nr:glycosyltransferase family 2 protein [Ferroglobus sp.]
MQVSVVISTYTEERFQDVRRCIESLKNQTRKPDEIVLVLDPIDDLVSFYETRMSDEVRIVESSGFGLSNARNKGVEVSKSDIIAFIDDDAWADKYWLENLLRNFEDKKVWVAGGRIVPVFDGKRPRWLAEELDWIVGCTYKGMPETKAEVRNPIGANMAFRREVFDVAGKFRSEVGRYGKKLLGSEETELCMRLKKIKPEVKVIYDPSAVVYHRVPESRAKLSYALRRAYYEGYSKAILSKEYELQTERSYTKTLLKGMLKNILKGRFSECFGILLVFVVVGLGWMFGKFR